MVKVEDKGEEGIGIGAAVGSTHSTCAHEINIKYSRREGHCNLCSPEDRINGNVVIAK